MAGILDRGVKRDAILRLPPHGAFADPMVVE
jgi:hypothetical protein